MKNRFKGLVFIGLTLALTMAPILADTAEGKDTAKSEAVVTFTKPSITEPVAPVDPTDPTKPLTPLDPEDGKGTGSIGDLTIDYVPRFVFSATAITGGDQTIKATSAIPFVQVSDRRATGKGWTLTAQLSDFVNGDHTIKNSTITLSNGAVVKVDEKSNSGSPVMGSKIELTTTSPQPIMTATAGNGMGTWLGTWLRNGDSGENEHVVLNINTKDARVGTYTSEINWVLAQQP